MAEFCQQCSFEVWGEDLGDFAKTSTPEMLTQPLLPGFGYKVVCEGCGPALVDNDGRCISPSCDRKHGKRNLFPGFGT